MAYITQDEANTYFLTRLNSDAWFDEPEYIPSVDTIDRKQAALETATRMIDFLSFRGVKTDSTQTNAFPRNGDTEVPDAIKLACAELALSLLDGMDPAMEYEGLSMTSQTYSNIRSAYDRTILPEHVVAGIPSIEAWRFLLPYISNPEAIRLNRVS